jgi:dTDP-D-glucose 4,6-dehydratase
MLGWSPRFNLEEGLKQTIDWYTSTHKSAGNVDESLLLERKY